MAFYLKRIATRDTPEDAAERLAQNAARAQVRLDRERLYPVITPENFAEVAAYQERRLEELLALLPRRSYRRRRGEVA